MKALSVAVSVAVLFGGIVGANAGTSSSVSPSLPSIGSLNANSDYSVFMQEGVPDALRLQALSKLWSHQAELSPMDELTDYDNEIFVVSVSGSQIKAHATAMAATDDVVEQPSLPSVGSLGANSDYTVFMQAGVPDSLRTQALYKLWHSQHPVIATVDNLTDYGNEYAAVTKTEDRLAFMMK